jgi:SAM-dependent methyltransferase
VNTTGYWNDALADVSTRVHPPLWRFHADRLNQTLIDRWAAGRRVDRVLVTDLFDESCRTGSRPALERAGRTVIGVDVAETVCARARRIHRGLRTAVAEVTALPFRDGAFDRIVSRSTLDHFETHEEIETALSEIRRCLAPGGELWLTLDNAGHPLIALRGALPFAWLQRTGLVPYFVGATDSAGSLRKRLTRTGYDVREIGTQMHCPRVFAIQIARRLGSASEGIQRRFLECLAGFERLDRCATRFQTGHFVTARAVRR